MNFSRLKLTIPHGRKNSARFDKLVSQNLQQSTLVDKFIRIHSSWLDDSRESCKILFFEMGAVLPFPSLVDEDFFCLLKRVYGTEQRGRWPRIMRYVCAVKILSRFWAPFSQSGTVCSFVPFIAKELENSSCCLV